MNRKTIISSNLESIGYDSINQVLEIKFHGGGIYQYLKVSSSVHSGLMAATTSHGSFFHSYIKGRYSTLSISTGSANINALHGFQGLMQADSLEG